MKIVAFGDIHRLVSPHRYEAVIERERPDRTIFLGDYFNDYGDGPAEAEESALWLLRGFKDPKRIFLIGNHDMPYLFPEHPQAVILPRIHTPEKFSVIKKVFGDDVRSFRTGVFEHPYLFTQRQ